MDLTEMVQISLLVFSDGLLFAVLVAHKQSEGTTPFFTGRFLSQHLCCCSSRLYTTHSLCYE